MLGVASVLLSPATWIVGRLVFASALAVFLCASDGWAWWVGQGLLTLCLVQWFVVMHECGHGTMFKPRLANLWFGHLASVFTAIPYLPWRAVHHQHHKWTGWQDLDPTTAVLCPRERSLWFLFLLNSCWRFGLPVFIMSYRLNNFWRLGRLRRMFPRATLRRGFRANVWCLGGFYALVLGFGGRAALLTGALAIFCANWILEVILLSQHSHLPMRIAGGERVRPLPALSQGPYTRTLRFPAWLSRWWLLGFDLHQLHHEHPRTPGYRLHTQRSPETRALAHREVHWLRWGSWRKRPLPARSCSATETSQG